MISVIIPVKNGSNYIHEAIEGIIKQNINVEIIVVDDVSEDNTVKIAQSMGCTVIKHETTRGQVAGKNTGIKTAKGKYIMFHDHDDVMNEGALKRLYEAADVPVVMAKVKDFISPELPSEPVRQDAYHGLLTGCTLIKKEVFGIVGLWDENLKTGETVDFFMRLDEKNVGIKKLDFIAANRRIHEKNLGKTAQKQEYKDYASILRAKIGIVKK